MSVAPIEQVAATAVLDHASDQVQARFEEIATGLRNSNEWAEVRVEAGRTGGYRFVHLVLAPRHPHADSERLVATVTVTPCDVEARSSVTVRGDLSGEETGRIHIEVPSETVPAFAASPSITRVTESLVGRLIAMHPAQRA